MGGVEKRVRVVEPELEICQEIQRNSDTRFTRVLPWNVFDSLWLLPKCDYEDFRCVSPKLERTFKQLPTTHTSGMGRTRDSSSAGAISRAALE